MWWKMWMHYAFLSADGVNFGFSFRIPIWILLPMYSKLWRFLKLLQFSNLIQCQRKLFWLLNKKRNIRPILNFEIQDFSPEIGFLNRLTHELDIVGWISAKYYLMATTIPMSIKGAPTIQNFYFGPSDFDIKNIKKWLLGVATNREQLLLARIRYMYLNNYFKVHVCLSIRRITFINDFVNFNHL